MGKLKNHYADKLERDAMASTFKTSFPDNPAKPYGEWCDWLRAMHRPHAELANDLTYELRWRMTNAEYALGEDDDEYGIHYHVFELQRSIDHLINYLNSKGL